MNFLGPSHALPGVFAALGVVAIASSGLLLILRARRLSGRAFLLGVGFAVTSFALASFKTGGEGLSALDGLAVTAAVVGTVFILVGKGAAGVGLLLPAVGRWVAWPLFSQQFGSAPIILTAFVLVPLTIFFCIWILQRFLARIFGRGPADHVTGEYLTRTLDTGGSLLVAILTAPIRWIAAIFR